MAACFRTTFERISVGWPGPGEYRTAAHESSAEDSRPRTRSGRTGSNGSGGGGSGEREAEAEEGCDGAGGGRAGGGARGWRWGCLFAPDSGAGWGFGFLSVPVVESRSARERSPRQSGAVGGVR